MANGDRQTRGKRLPHRVGSAGEGGDFLRAAPVAPGQCVELVYFSRVLGLFWSTVYLLRYHHSLGFKFSLSSCTTESRHGACVTTWDELPDDEVRAAGGRP